MSTPSGDRVTNKQLYDELTKLRDAVPSKVEMRLTVALATLGANAVAAVIMKSTSAGPAVHSALAYALRLVN
jgi:hypothetical protein